MRQATSSQCGPALWEELRRWFEAMPGQLLLEQERDCIERFAADLFGYHLLQIGFPGGRSDLVSASRIRNHIVVDEQGQGVARDWTLQSQATRLPVASDSVDLVLLQHTLDFAIDPHQVLREAERVLIPEGRVMIFGFNPWSLWGLWRLARSRGPKVPWCAHFLGVKRVSDWLSLLGLELQASQNLMFRPPFRNQRLLQKSDFLESLGQRWWPILSGVYALQAVKRVSTLTPIRPRWATRPSVVGAGATGPTARGTG